MICFVIDCSLFQAFTRWANQLLVSKGIKISDIDNDLRNGTTLISLVEVFV
jgi:hypothetical protein